ncbi:MAG: phage virion morphogenesis protein [Sinobacteraceae bacterium]|nr:phage virion morphogenesis protein [Nevskiaceae bacterium]
MIDDRELVNAIAHVTHVVGSPDDIWRDVGEHLLNSTRDRIKRGVTPDGSAFQPLTKEYEARKLRKVGRRPILEYDLHMVGDRFTYSVDHEGLIIGTDVPYGRAQHYGYAARGLPSRPWLGLSDDDRDEVRRIVGKHLMDAISKRF